MTSYRYNITLSDSEVIALEDGLQLLEAHLETLNGEAPAYAHTQSITSIRQKLQDGRQLRSTNNFWNEAADPLMKDPRDMTPDEIARLRIMDGPILTRPRKSGIARMVERDMRRTALPGVEAKARELCAAAGKDPDRISIITDANGAAWAPYVRQAMALLGYTDADIEEA